jgi:dTDP-3-amino-3,4,6-trideoxy-alpha-D-glucose transaminase
MSVPFFDLGRLISSERSQLHQALDLVIDSGYFVGGPSVSSFEEEFAHYLGSKFFRGVGNGLDAIRLLLEAHDIGEGDEVIVPGFTYYATWLAIMQTGAKIVPVDVSLGNASIDPQLIQDAITSRTKAIVAVHLFGHAADMAAIVNIAKQHNLLVFEDAAQAHGLISSEGMVGSYGDGVAFSFYPTKNLGALGDAGGIATNSQTTSEKILSRRSYGQGLSKYDHVDTGWNTRLDPLQAEFLRVHLGKLNSWNEVRRDVADSYLKALGNNHTMALGHETLNSSVWHHFVLSTPERDKARNFLSENFGINTDVHYPYFIKSVTPAFEAISEEFKNVNLPNSEKLSKQVFSLPMGPWMKEEEIQQVCKGLESLGDQMA